MLNFDSEVAYVVSQVLVRSDGADNDDIIHEELECYLSSLYDYKADEVLASYGVIKALQEYISQNGEVPSTSQAMLYAIMVDKVRECV